MIIRPSKKPSTFTFLDQKPTGGVNGKQDKQSHYGNSIRQIASTLEVISEFDGFLKIEKV